MQKKVKYSNIGCGGCSSAVSRRRGALLISAGPCARLNGNGEQGRPENVNTLGLCKKLGCYVVNIVC